MPKQSWVDANGIEHGQLGDLRNGIPIEERNRATVYEWRAAGIKELHDFMVNNYSRKGVNAVLYGVRLRDKNNFRKLTKDIYYAVFVQDGFLTTMESEADEA